MEIKEGKRYWTRGGWITPIIRRSKAPANPKYPFTVGSNSYTKNGRYVLQAETPFDLIAEYTGPELVPPLIPEVGKRYVDEKEGVTPPVKAVHDSKVWFEGPYRGAFRWFSELKREYQGADDPINKETPCAS